jgi:CheY-like chemotaxis protein
MTRRKKFGEILVEAGVVDDIQLRQALARQRGTAKRLGEVLEELGVVKEKDIAVAVAHQFGFKVVKQLARFNYPSDVLAMVRSEEALQLLIFPLKFDESGALLLAMVNPLDLDTINNLTFRIGKRIVPCVTTPSEIQEAVARHYLERGAAKGGADWWTILVVDDQDMMRNAILAALRPQGYTLYEARNGAEALKLASTHPPHLVITEIIMPRMNGTELIDALRRNPVTRSVPVMTLTSRASAEEEARLLDYGFFDFVAKPVNPVRLLARVKRALHLAYGSNPPVPP